MEKRKYNRGNLRFPLGKGSRGSAKELSTGRIPLKRKEGGRKNASPRTIEKH